MSFSQRREGFNMRSASILVFVALLLRSATGWGVEPQQPRWIAVVPQSAQAAIEPLCDRRRKEGMDVRIISVDETAAAEDAPHEAARLKAEIEQRCEGRTAANYVLLAGSATRAAAGEIQDATALFVPMLDGTVGRMKGIATDHAYSKPDADATPTVAVGRFPARTTADLSAMVEKTLAFESSVGQGAWSKRLTVLVGDPGGASALEQRAAEIAGPSTILGRFAQLDSTWTHRFVMHVAGSPYNVHNEDLRDVSTQYLSEGQVFAMFLGHSSAPGMWSGSARFLDRRDWAKLKIGEGRGVFFTGGCFSCRTSGSDGEGYGLAAIRNPAGPVAVIGAYGESYAAFGLLALDGLLSRLREREAAPRLADYWMAIKTGLSRGNIEPLMFWILDNGDGSRGKVSLAVQRREHSEMWTLFGDPATKLFGTPREISLETNDIAVAGGELRIAGGLPGELRAASVRLTLDRPLGSQPTGIVPLPAEPEKLREVLLSNHRQANDLTVASVLAEAREGKFDARLKVPDKAPWKHLVIRAVTDSSPIAAQGAISVAIDKDASKAEPPAR
jgi:hypothetical protein